MSNFFFEEFGGKEFEVVAKVINLPVFEDTPVFMGSMLAGAVAAYSTTDGISPDDHWFAEGAIMPLVNMAEHEVQALVAFARALATEGGPAAQWEAFVATIKE